MAESAREQILHRIRTALGEPGSKGESGNNSTVGVGDTLLTWQSAPPIHARPAADSFLARVEASAATWEQLEDESQLRDAVTAWCQRHGIKQLVTADPLLAALAWPEGLLQDGRPASTGSATLCRAAAGVAETGSVLLLSETHSVAALNVLPEHLLVVLDPAQVVIYLEEAMSSLHDGGMSWSANLVTGPSRTGDVEQTIELGAHGPRFVHLLLVPGTGL